MSKARTEYHAYTKQQWDFALANAVGGDFIFVHGVWDTSMGVSGKIYPDLALPLTIDGKDAELKQGFAITNCYNVIVQGFTITGSNGTAGCEINDTHHDIGVRDIVLRDLKIYYAGPRGIMMGGWNIANITISGCHIKGPLGGTHGIYMTGAHWIGSEVFDPIDGVTIEGCLIEFQPDGRHGIQFNGRFTNGLIQNNLIRHAQLNGISLIGCQHFDVLNNVVYGCNRGAGLVIYDYAHSWANKYNYFHTQADVDLFNETHQPNQHILAEYNTFIVGPKQFSQSPYHKDDPTKSHPVVLVNNGVASGFMAWDPVHTDPGQWVNHPRPGITWPFPSKNFLIQNCIMWTPSLNIIDTYHSHEGLQTVLNHDMVHSTHAGVPLIGKSGVIGAITNMVWENPGFDPPVYDFLDFIAQNINIHCYDIWDNFHTYFNAFSYPGKKLGIGKKFPVYFFAQESRVLSGGSGASKNTMTEDMVPSPPMPF
jgi:hypothetical protein